MRKRKAYLGQNKNPHNLGRSKGNGLKWVVPRMLREYFDLRRACGYENHAMKINMNKAFGMMGTPYPDLYKTTPSNEPVVARPKATSFPDDGWQNVDHMAHRPTLRIESYEGKPVILINGERFDSESEDVKQHVEQLRSTEFGRKVFREDGSVDVFEVAKMRDAQVYKESLEQRKRAKQGYLGHLSVQAMRELLKPAHERV